MKYVYCFILCVLLGLSNLYSINRSSYSFYHVSSEDGLSASNVKTILQDSYGFMWFGTKNGLNRYDGKSVVRFDCDDRVQGVSNHNISALFEDANHCLWVGTDRGVYRYDLREDVFSFVSLKSDKGIAMENWVSNIVSDKSGNIWVVIPDQGIFRYKDEKLYHYQISQKFKIESPNGICVCDDGEIYIATWNVGLFRYNKRKDIFEQITEDTTGRSLLGMEINSLYQQNDYLILSLQTGAIKKYNYKRNLLSDMPLLQCGNTIVRNVLVVDNEIWVGTHDGLYILNEKEGTSLHLKQNMLQPFSLSDDIIYTMYQDRQGGIWLGTMFGGANYLSKRRFTFESYLLAGDDFSMGKQRIRGLVQGDDGTLWIGTENDGVSIFTPHNGKICNYAGIGKELVLGLWNYDGKIYVGLYKKGLIIIEGAKITTCSPQQLGLEEGSVYSFLVDRKGRKWIGTGWGLYRQDLGSEGFMRVKEVGYDWIFDMYEDSHGTLWIASMGSGLWKYDAKKDLYKKYLSDGKDAHSLSSNSVSAIMEDHKGQIWLSTDRGGICKYDVRNDGFVRYSLSEGFPDDVAYKILEDMIGNLWMGTNQGLVQFNPESGNMRVFTVENGLLGNQFNYQSAVKGHDGKFYFGSVNGLVSFNPYVKEELDKSYPVYISRLSIYNEEITVHTPNSPLKTSIIETKNIVLPYNRSNISLDISALSFFSSSDNQFYYRLLPSEKVWNYSNDNSRISYANMSPGKYVFQVCTDINNENSSVRSLKITILPPWWASNLAYFFYILLGISALLGWFFWYRNRKNKQLLAKQRFFEVQKEKELYQAKIEFFTEIAHEVRTPLTLINGPLEVIQEMEIKEPLLIKNLQVIAKNTKRLLNLTAQLLDFQKIGAYKLKLTYEDVNVTNLLQETIDRFEPTMVHESKELEVKMPDEEIWACIDREAITKILSNLLNNARKYGKKQIKIELTYTTTHFIVKVASDGEKIAVENEQKIFEPFYQVEKQKINSGEGVGIGLPLARSLASLHKGSLYLDNSQENNVFVLSIPLNRSQMAVVRQNVEMEKKEVLLHESPMDKNEFSGYKLLIVEDDASILQFMKERLQEYFMVETAMNGQLALEVLRNEHIDLVISDVMMPVMDGYELCSRIKSDINLCHIPVIFLTAKNDLTSKLSGLKVGAEAYVEKPFSFDFLKTQILSLLSNRRKEREAFSKRPFFPVNNMQLSKEDEDFMNQVIEAINKNIVDDGFNVEKLADILCLSRSSLLRKIKTLFNMSPVDFIRLIRLKKAAQLILEGEFRIGEIVYMVGFSSPSYFSKMFLKQFGMTPKEFEKQIRTQQRAQTGNKNTAE